MAMELRDATHLPGWSSGASAAPQTFLPTLARGHLKLAIYVQINWSPVKKSNKDDADTSGMSTQRKTSLNAHSVDNRTCRWCTMDPMWPCQA